MSFYDNVPAMIKQITDEIGWLREGVTADETLSADEMKEELAMLEAGPIAELKQAMRHLFFYRRRRSNLTPADQLDNLFAELAEACPEDDEMAYEVLREAGYGPEEIVRKVLALVKRLQKEARERLS